MATQIAASDTGLEITIDLLCDWLDAKLGQDAARNIEDLSLEDGPDYQILVTLLETRELPASAIEKTVELLTKEEIRNSVEYDKTYKLYASLLGSPFMPQLQSHIQSLCDPELRELRNYVKLMEVIGDRTSDGWKEIPLDAIRRKFVEIETKTDENAIALRTDPDYQALLSGMKCLLQLREEASLRHAAMAKDSRKVEEYYSLPILASKAEVVAAGTAPKWLPIIPVGTRYPSVYDCLHTNFQLLREDYIEPLRHSINVYRHNKRYPLHEQGIFAPVWFNRGFGFGRESIEHKVYFSYYDGELFRRHFRFGSLVCFSKDDFLTCFWAVVVEFRFVGKGNDQAPLITIRILPSPEPERLPSCFPAFGPKERYVMVASPAHFEPYFCVLKALQSKDMCSELVFAKHLIALEPEVGAPSYLTTRPQNGVYNFSKVFPEMVRESGRESIDVLKTWPDWEYGSLSESQTEALKHGLTKEVALIQGPPGTGKTYVGLLLIRILLANLKQRNNENTGAEPSEDLPSLENDVSGPILVVCDRDHTLDQFLLRIYEHEENVIRLGGGSKEEKLRAISLPNLLKAHERGTSRTDLHQALRKADDEVQKLMRQIKDEYLPLFSLKRVNRRSLRLVLTSKEIDLLFLRKNDTPDSKQVPREAEILEIWLSGGRKGDAIVLYNDVDDDEGPLHKNDPSDAIPVASNVDDEEEEAPKETGRRSTKGKTKKWYGNPEEMYVADVWKMSTERVKLHKCWLKDIKREAKTRIRRLSKKYEEACKARSHMIQLSLLRQAKVVGMTTVEGARLRDTLVALKPEIVLVEEAGAVLESHVLACLAPSTKHLILIGDHHQLRPSVSVRSLAQTNKLDVSLFERLIAGGVEYKSLDVQRRMRPTISNLLSGIYPNLKNDPAVSLLPDVQGMKHNVYFFDTEEKESSSTALSEVNRGEASVIVELCIYLLNQDCYSAKDITILCLFFDQVKEISRLLTSRIQARYKANHAVARAEDFPRVASVDDFQGEESNIVLLSLVRGTHLEISDNHEKIGFLSVPNRACFALSRAKQGLYIFGDAELLAERSELWKTVARTPRQSNMLGPHLSLYCQNHPQEETKVASATDFRQVADGGCSRPCKFRFQCGHVCPRLCHPRNHEQMVCPKICSKQHDTCGHTCSEPCHRESDCPPCTVRTTRQMPGCGHEEVVPCFWPGDQIQCQGRCHKMLDCGHSCSNICGMPCVEECLSSVERSLPCGHSQEDPCSQDTASIVCRIPCTTILERCGHECSGTCGSCKGSHHPPCPKPCRTVLPCGHPCEAACRVVCPPCQRPCQKRCVHGACKLKCGEACVPCMEKCSWQCSHYQCNLPCHEPCKRRRCDRLCHKQLKGCSHRCYGLCGELCPTKCKACDYNSVDFLSKKPLKDLNSTDRLMQLHDCRHVFEVTGLDRWMEQEQEDGEEASTSEPQTTISPATSIKLKQCPECKTPILRSNRYANIVKRTLSETEALKTRIRSSHHCSFGDQALNGGHPLAAIEFYQQALEQEPGLAEAYYGIGCAYAATKSSPSRASFHLLHVISRSRFKDLPVISAASTALPGDPGTSSMAPTSSNQDVQSVGVSLAIKAMLQLASLFLEIKQFEIAEKLSEAILNHDPHNVDAKQVNFIACNYKEIHLAFIRRRMAQQ